MMPPFPKLLLPRAGALALVLAACSSSTTDGGVPPVAYVGALPATLPARYVANTLSVQASINASTARPFLVDTGSPITGFDPSAWPDANVASSTSVLGSLAVGPLTFTQVPSAALSECGTACGPYDAAGLLGGNVLRSFVVAFDYRTPAVVLGPTAVPATVQASPTIVAFVLAGGGRGTIAGGNGQIVEVPPTRLVVQAQIDGAARTLVVDTGASFTLLRQSLFAPLVADGRAQLTFKAATATGATQGTVARARSLRVGAAAQAGSPVGGVADADMDSIASETGHAVDGLLGGSFLRAFYAVVDYGNGHAALYPYTAADPVADEFTRVGVFLAASGGGYVVSHAVATTDSGLVGAMLVDVDGTTVAGKDPEQADRLLRGSLGATHTLHLQRGGVIEAKTLPVQDVLPLPP